MSFCPGDKNSIIFKHLMKCPIFQKLTEEEKLEIRSVTLQALEEIERKEFEYKQMR